ncbi:MAG TPA: hypothetical protein VGF96_10190 [Terracidiphilus sp.]|jgi:hypothetical protein
MRRCIASHFKRLDLDALDTCLVFTVDSFVDVPLYASVDSPIDPVDSALDPVDSALDPDDASLDADDAPIDPVDTSLDSSSGGNDALKHSK